MDHAGRVPRRRPRGGRGDLKPGRMLFEIELRYRRANLRPWRVWNHPTSSSHQNTLRPQKRSGLRPVGRIRQHPLESYPVG